MKLFNSNLNYLGVDIGSAGIKVVELKNENGRPRLITYGFVDESIDIVHNSSEEMENKIVGLLTKILEKSNTTSKKVVTALPSFSVFSSIISLPQMKRKELGQAVYWQAKKFVPMPLEEMTLDWKVLDNSLDIVDLKNGNGKPDPNTRIDPNDPNDPNSKKEKKSAEKKDLKILIAAAPKKLVMRYINVLKKSGLELISLETENFALERSLVGGDKSPVMIVDIGSITSDISVVENGIPLLSRSVDTGGNTITEAIMQSMHIDLRRAEQFKRDIGFTSESGNLPKVIESSIAPIINEIKYSFNLYASQQTQKGIEKIILTGGCAFLPNMPEYLSKLLNINVLIGDPWSRIVYPLELKSILDNLAPRYSVAVGLAMREIV